MPRLLLTALLILTTPHVALPFLTAPAARPTARAPPAVCRLRAQARLAGPHAPPTILSLPYPELCELVGEREARSAWNLYRIGADPAAAPDAAAAESVRPAGRKFTVSPATREALSDMALPALVRTEEVSVAKDGTTKLLLRLSDGLAVETVLIPPLHKEGVGRSARAKTSLCVSSQVGCVRGCRFCSTGAMGIVRSLSPDEILATVVLSRREAALRALPSVDNIVFMGMGEPLDNPDAVIPALSALTDANRFDFSRAKVLISTVGPSPEALLRLADVDCQLAWSVHAADDATRSALVPSTRHTMLELRDAMMQVLEARRARGSMHGLMVEYVLLNGVNDSLLHATRLADFLLPLHDATRDTTKNPNRKRTGLLVNLIPFNEGADGGLRGFKRPERGSVEAFQAELRRKGVWASVRVQRGDDESAACGMLATKRSAGDES